jgi:hypothetical protein
VKKIKKLFRKGFRRSVRKELADIKKSLVVEKPTNRVMMSMWDSMFNLFGGAPEAIGTSVWNQGKELGDLRKELELIKGFLKIAVVEIDKKTIVKKVVAKKKSNKGRDNDGD